MSDQESRGKNFATEVFDRLLKGDSLEQVARETSMAPREAVEAIAHVGLYGEAPARPSLVQERPLHPELQDAFTEQKLAALFPRTPRTGLLGLSAGLLLIHDFWNASHEAAQLADDLGERHTSAYWHGIAHRREPDPSNASYWFRRVGKHSIFPKLATFAKTRLAESQSVEGARRLLEGGVWNPFAMIELCDGAKSGSPAESIALDLQREEMRLLLEATLDSLAV